MYRFLLMNLFFIPLQINAQIPDKSVMIIGAGLSGFSAARRLISKGFNNITILETLDRIGGRVHSVPFSVGYVDLGAQWIHGQKNNIIYEMTTKDRSVQLGSTPFETVNPYFRFSNGTLPAQEVYRKVYELAYEVIDSIDEIENTQGKTYMQLFDIRFNRKVLNLKIDKEILKFVKEEVTKDLISYFAATNLNEVSAKLSNEEEEASGNQHVTWKTFGFQKFFDILNRGNDITTKIKFSKKVEKIQYNMKDGSAKVAVTCDDGTLYQASHVIFTASLGYLKANHKSTFNPPLPPKKVLAIESRGFGSVGKIFMEFEKPFWKIRNEPFVAINGMWLDEDVMKVKDTEREWLLGIVAVYAVDGFENVIEVFLGGEHVLLFEQTPTDKIVKDMIWWLEKFAPYTKPVPVPKNIKRTKWLTDGLFLGTYSYPSMKEERNKVRTMDLARSILSGDKKPIILFAGEATDLKYPSMAHGAVNSGFRAADEIIAHYK